MVTIKSAWESKGFMGIRLTRKKISKRIKTVADNFYQKENPLIELINTLILWVKNKVKNQVKCFTDKMSDIGLSSVAQWCIILVMLYLTLVG